MSAFVHPSNGHREEVSASGSWLGAFFFGLFYFMFKGIWRHVLIQLVAIGILLGAFGAPGTMFIALMWIIYSFCAQGIVEQSYLRQGYILAQDHPTASTSYSPDGLSHVAPRAAPKPDDGAFERAMKEWDSPDRQSGLWARLFATYEGDEGRAKAAYIKERAESFAIAGQPRQLGESSPLPAPPPT